MQLQKSHPMPVLKCPECVFSVLKRLCASYIARDASFLRSLESWLHCNTEHLSGCQSGRRSFSLADTEIDADAR